MVLCFDFVYGLVPVVDEVVGSSGLDLVMGSQWSDEGVDAGKGS